MDVGNVAVEAGFGVVIGQEADILEFIAEDWWLWLVFVYEGWGGIRAVYEEDDCLCL